MYLSRSIAFLLILFCTPAFNIFAQCNPSWIEIPNNGIDEDCDGLDEVYLNLPNYIYATVGQDFELYFHNVFLSKHPQDYQFVVNTNLPGQTQSKKWVFTPQNAQIGQHNITLELKTPSGTVVASAQSIIRVSPAGFPSNTGPKKLLLLGHSFFDQGYMPFYLYERIQQGINPPITFYGSKQSWTNPNVRYEGHGGQTWQWFTTTEESPLTFGPNDQVNMPQYFNENMCTNCRPDWIVIYLDINDFCGYTPLTGLTLQEIDDTISSHYARFANRLIDSIRLAAPNAKIGICTAPPPNKRESAFEERFGTGNVLNDKWRWQKIVSRLLYSHNSRFGYREHENIYLIPTHLDIDDFLEYPEIDPIHPSPPNGDLSLHCGYRELGKSIYSWIKFVQNLPSTQTWYRDADTDGYGTPNLTQPAPTQPQGYTAISGDCDDTNPNINPSKKEICDNGIDDDCNGLIDEDWQAPLAKCVSNVALDLDAYGLATLTIADLDAGSADECGSVTLALTKSSFTCYDTGFHFVFLTATDEAGNSATCSSAISLNDSTKPILTAKATLPTVILGANGSFIQDITALVAASDPCLRTFAYSRDNINFIEDNSVYFDCMDASNVQPLRLYIKAIDLNENSSNVLEIDIEVIENQAPTVICKNLQTNLDEDGETVVEVHQLFSSKNDNCGSTEFIGPTLWGFDCNHVGIQQVTLTVTDPSGNTATCTAEITILDDKKPTIQCASIDVFLNADSEASLVAEGLILNKADNCGVPTYIGVNQFDFTCADLGSQLVTLMVKDASGNSASCIAELTIFDEIDSDGDGLNNCMDACPFDSAFTTIVSYYVDWDGDSYGSTEVGGISCTLPLGMSWVNTDCDDNNASIYPNAPELLDGIDNDCDNEIDEETIATFSPKNSFDIQIQPNPTSHSIFIPIGEHQVQHLTLYAVTGAKVQTLTWSQEDKNLYVSLENMPAGSYFIKIQTEKGAVAFGKVLKI